MRLEAVQTDVLGEQRRRLTFVGDYRVPGPREIGGILNGDAVIEYWSETSRLTGATAVTSRPLPN
jgi:hypothetical protein